MKVVIIGSGNVATVLGRKIKEAGHEILEIVGRNEESVSTLALELNADKIYKLNIISSLADIYLIAVSDKAIVEIADELRVDDKLVVHTAASRPIDILENCSTNYGVIYPLQTINKDVNNYPDIPFLVNGVDTATIDTLTDFCSQLSGNVRVASDDERLKLHLGAVFLNNFTNHLFALTQHYFKSNHLDFDLLRPLVEKTLENVKSEDAAKVQTGPAIRNDFETMKKHRHLLEEYPLMQKLYEEISNSIIELHKKDVKNGFGIIH